MEQFFETLQEWAKRFPGSIALASQTGYMTYEDFVGNVTTVANAATRNKVVPGQFIVLAGANPDAQLIIALSLLHLGCRVGYSRDIGIYESSGVTIDAVIADAAIPGSKHRVITIGRNWFGGAEGTNLKLSPPATDFSMVFSSSGSTGRPKLIEFERKALLHKISVRVSDSLFGTRPRFLSALGTRTAAHFSNVFAVLLRGGMAIGPKNRNGSTVLDTIELFRPEYLFTTPSTLVEILHRLDKKPMAFDKIRLLIASGSRFAAGLQRAVLDKFSEEFISFYGSTETGGIAWGSSKDVLEIDGCVGRVADGVDVATYSSDGERLSPGAEGKIRVKGQVGVFGKYIGDDAQHLSFANGWFVTGDIGFVDKDKNLIIRGRSSNVINTGGSKVSPEVLEEEIRAFSQVRDVGVTGVDRPEGFEKICAAIVSKSKPTVADINALLHRRNARWPVHMVKNVSAIPKTDSGKIDRVALRRLCSE